MKYVNLKYVNNVRLFSNSEQNIFTGVDIKHIQKQMRVAQDILKLFHLAAARPELNTLGYVDSIRKQTVGYNLNVKNVKSVSDTKIRGIRVFSTTLRKDAPLSTPHTV